MEWTRGHIIGHGSSATVYLATSSHSSDISAVKSAEMSHPRSEQLQREQRILSSLCSSYIVTYKGYDVTRENSVLWYNLFMEYMPFGTLSHVTRQNGWLDEPAITRYTRQVLQGLEYLHANGVVHCDIKGSNILVGEEGAKIGDFGCAKRVDDPAAVISGTPMFMAPEVARGEEQGFPCDIWALGCTIIEMATGLSPWPNVEDAITILYRIAYSGELPMIPSFLSDQAKDFLEKCLRRNPKERWNCSQLLKHPFLEEFNSNVNKQIQEFDSSSPTSILDQGIWNSVEESEIIHGNLVQTSSENSPNGRIRKLALCSGEPNWKLNDENWITVRCSDEESSTSDALDLGENVSGRIISDYFCEDYSKIRDVSFLVNSLNFERGVAEMVFTSTLDFL